MKGVIEFEYETIVDERENEVVFLFRGCELLVPRGQLHDYDLEGRFWVGAEDAAALGISN